MNITPQIIIDREILIRPKKIAMERTRKPTILIKVFSANIPKLAEILKPPW